MCFSDTQVISSPLHYELKTICKTEDTFMMSNKCRSLKTYSPTKVIDIMDDISFTFSSKQDDRIETQEATPEWSQVLFSQL